MITKAVLGFVFFYAGIIIVSLLVLYLIIKNAIKNAIVQAHDIIKSNEIDEE